MMHWIESSIVKAGAHHDHFSKSKEVVLLRMIMFNVRAAVI
jgi:hypothetical protein